MTRRYSLAAAVVGILGLLALVGPVSAANRGVRIGEADERYFFGPQTQYANVGDTVTWTVTEAISDPHSVTSGSYKDAKPGTEFDSGIKLKSNGDSFSHTFAAAGSFSFFCAVHPDTMSGTITVVEAGGSTGGETQGGGIPVESKLIAGAILVVTLIVLFGWASLYRRMNPAR
jgi:plastocyanin